MSTEYKVTLGLRIYRACPSGIFFSEFICQNSFSSQFLSNVRSGEVTLLASTKSGSLLSPPPPHTSEPDLEFVKKFTRPNFPVKEFCTLKTRKSRLFLPTINSKNTSL